HRATYIQGILYQGLNIYARSDGMVLDRLEGNPRRNLLELESSFVFFGGHVRKGLYHQFKPRLEDGNTPESADWEELRGVELGFALMLSFYFRRFSKVQKGKALPVLAIPIHDV